MRPRFSAASFEPSTSATAALSRWTHRVGVSTRICFTPTWNAIGLSLPVAFAAKVVSGSLSPWHSFLPPHAHRRRAFDAGGGESAGRAERTRAQLKKKKGPPDGQPRIAVA
jgi:hypothetical protein